MGVIPQPLQLGLHLPTQLAVLLQQLHLRYRLVEELAVVPGQGLDLPDIEAQVHDLGVESRVNIHITGNSGNNLVLLLI